MDFEDSLVDSLVVVSGTPSATTLMRLIRRGGSTFTGGVAKSSELLLTTSRLAVRSMRRQSRVEFVDVLEDCLREA